jgi:hypothetical protein
MVFHLDFMLRLTETLHSRDLVCLCPQVKYKREKHILLGPLGNVSLQSLLMKISFA